MSPGHSSLQNRTQVTPQSDVYNIQDLQFSNAYMSPRLKSSYFKAALNMIYCCKLTYPVKQHKRKLHRPLCELLKTVKFIQ
uniref:Uncharacterized protein n=1 Tax=Arion vulgaris TaxID=1028688 RepID=A0A0B6ZQT7_9EUPU